MEQNLNDFENYLVPEKKYLLKTVRIKFSFVCVCGNKKPHTHKKHISGLLCGFVPPQDFISLEYCLHVIIMWLDIPRLLCYFYK